jgi:hypothetical protein
VRCSEKEDSKNVCTLVRADEASKEMATMDCLFTLFSCPDLFASQQDRSVQGWQAYICPVENGVFVSHQ